MKTNSEIREEIYGELGKFGLVKDKWNDMLLDLAFQKKDKEIEELKFDDIEKERASKLGVEILRYAGCLDDVDNDVAELCIKLVPKDGVLMSLADLTEGAQKIKDNLKKETQQKVKKLRKELINLNYIFYGKQRMTLMSRDNVLKVVDSIFGGKG